MIQSTTGHADLLARRRKIEKILADPRAPQPLRAKLALVADVRRFSVERMGLAKSRDFTTYVDVGGPAVSWLVSASPRTKLEPYQWSFPLAGKFPYKGYFNKKRALAESARMEKLGYDACVFGAAAYNTPLPVSDPLPSSALERSTGALAALIIHELAHGSLKVKDMAVNEAASEFIGRRGAQQYLAERFGLASAELKAYAAELLGDRKADVVFAALRADLEKLYAEPVPDAAKLARREAVFAKFKPIFEALGLRSEPLNNAVVTAHDVYGDERDFPALLQLVGGDWRRFVAELNSR